MTDNTQIEITDEGTLVLLTPTTPAAETWLNSNLDPAVQKWGPAFVIERRYVGSILAGAHAAGLLPTIYEGVAS